MNYQIGDCLVHPLHGAGVIDNLETRRSGGKYVSFYSLRLMASGMSLLVPVESCERIGVRPVMGADQVEELLLRLTGEEIPMDANWNKRYRDNMERVRSGDALQVGLVIKALTLRDRERGLSSGERRTLSSARQILYSELAMAGNIPMDEAEKRVMMVLFPPEVDA